MTQQNYRCHWRFTDHTSDLQIPRCNSANKHACRSACIYMHTSLYRATDILHITLNPQTSYWLNADENTTLTTLQMPHSKSHVPYYGITTTTLQIYRNDGSYLQMLAPQTYRCHTTMDRYTTDYYYYWYSALGPFWAETRVQSGDCYGSGTHVENDNATEVLIVVTKQLRHLKSPVTLPVHQNLGWDNIWT